MLGRLKKIVENLGNLTLQWRKAGEVRGSWVGTQFKSNADELAHEFLKEHLTKIGMDIPIYSEEDGQNFSYEDRPSKYWLIDPIDGTASFAEGYSGYVTQIALIEDAQPRLAAVHCPVSGDTYLAEKGKGVTCNCNFLPTLIGTTNNKTMIDNYPLPKNLTRRVYNDLGFTKYVESGSIGLKACKVADGTADLFYKNIKVRDWDIAPAHLIVEEVGGYLLGLDGEEYIYDGYCEKPGVIVARNMEIAKELISYLAKFKSN